jgi:thiaminase
MAGVIGRLREELRDLNERILNHPSLQKPSRAVLNRFVENQLYIIPHDLRALSHMLSKARTADEEEFFKLLVDGDYEASKALAQLAEELNTKLDYGRLSARAVGYTHFLSWLALNGTAGDAAVALTINLPVWGENVRKLGQHARSLNMKSTTLFELFAGPFDALEERAEKIAERYLDWSRYRFVARAIQRYELDFWDGLIE